jgi:hypothetical protein
MKLFALSILGLALAIPAARAQNQDTKTNDSNMATAQQGTDASKSTAQSGETSKAAKPMDKTDRPAAARSRDLGKSDDECMCECNGKMIKGKKGHPMGRGPANMDRSRPAPASDASRANPSTGPAVPPSDTPPGASTDTSSQPSKGTGEMNPGSTDKTDKPSNPR